MGIMFTTKLLDGLDGLVTSVGSVGTLMIVLLASSAMFFQPDVAVFASIILGALLGFIVWNLYPATIFLGESGALLIGFFLGVLAIISGGKIATLLLVMGVPLLDVVWVIGRRLVSRVPVTRGDRAHLHYRLFDMGWSQNHVVALYTCVAVSFGILTLVLSSFAKLIALAILTILMCAGVLMITLKQRKRR
ncbi:undecaprenyl/decaprenyl-phosphate alpha-N-acetylglucosaminyl 1-phosphate transferase [Candidatus Uhrbacteria bacterium]|nr:undecaprenyl/decaprenyl-phosphate alpha-N-acetylglucosaminyl 1-phosphate transferase [Candidatus Uhrbacteria bacterium]